MTISEKFGDGFTFIRKRLWIIFIPIVIDLANLFSWEKIYHTKYVPAYKMFMIKIGLVGEPPSVKYLFEDFPSALLKYDNYGFSGIINKFSLFNVSLFLTVMLVSSFLDSGYMSIIGTSNEKKVSISDFFVLGNKNWAKFFLLDLITGLTIILIIFNRELVFLSFVNILFVYVRYSFAVDKVNVLQNFKLGIEFLFDNIVLSIKMALYFGLIFSVISLVMFPLSRLGTMGIVIDIIIFAYMGAASNKAVLEIYKIGGKDI